MNRTKDREDVRRALDQFVTAWALQDISHLHDFLVKEPFVYFSIFGNCYTQEELASHMMYPSERITKGFMEIVDHSCAMDGDKAQQFATMIGYFADETAGRYIAFGGDFANSLVKEDGVWKLHTMRFELKTDNAAADEILTENGIIEKTAGEGDIELIGKWLKVNDRVGFFMDPVEGQGEHTIMPEQDAPWTVITCRDDDEKDTVQEMEELVNRFFCAYDQMCFYVMKDILSENVIIKTQKKEIAGRYEGLMYLKMLRQGSPRSFHAMAVEDLKTDGAKAVFSLHRYAPECFAKDKRQEGRKAFWARKYMCSAVLENGCWEIDTIEI